MCRTLLLIEQYHRKRRYDHRLVVYLIVFTLEGDDVGCPPGPLADLHLNRDETL